MRWPWASAAGVGLYKLAPSAALFMALVLWVVEYFEPTARKKFELTVSAPNTAALRPKVEGVLSGFQLDFELISESDDELGYSVSTPITIRTRDVSDTIRLVERRRRRGDRVGRKEEQELAATAR